MHKHMSVHPHMQSHTRAHTHTTTTTTHPRRCLARGTRGLMGLRGNWRHRRWSLMDKSGHREERRGEQERRGQRRKERDTIFTHPLKTHICTCLHTNTHTHTHTHTHTLSHTHTHRLQGKGQRSDSNSQLGCLR